MSGAWVPVHQGAAQDGGPELEPSGPRQQAPFWDENVPGDSLPDPLRAGSSLVTSEGPFSGSAIIALSLGQESELLAL